MTSTKIGRLDDDGVFLTNGGEFITTRYVFDDEGNVRNSTLCDLKRHLLQNPDIVELVITPSGKDAHVYLKYESGATRVGGAQDLYFKAVLDAYTQNRAAFDHPEEGEFVRIVPLHEKYMDEEIEIESYVAALLKL